MVQPARPLNGVYMRRACSCTEAQRTRPLHVLLVPSHHPWQARLGLGTTLTVIAPNSLTAPQVLMTVTINGRTYTGLLAPQPVAFPGGRPPLPLPQPGQPLTGLQGRKLAAVADHGANALAVGPGAKLPAGEEVRLMPRAADRFVPPALDGPLSHWSMPRNWRLP